VRQQLEQNDDSKKAYNQLAVLQQRVASHNIHHCTPTCLIQHRGSKEKSYHQSAAVCCSADATTRRNKFSKKG